VVLYTIYLKKSETPINVIVNREWEQTNSALNPRNIKDLGIVWSNTIIVDTAISDSISMAKHRSAE
jgi:hypothetical protein